MTSELILELAPELETEYREKIAARRLRAAKKRRELKNGISDAIPSAFAKFCRSKAAEATKNNNDTITATFDNKGRVFISPASLRSHFDAEAIKKHGNCPIRRFEQWEFPGTPQERDFLLNHNFGSVIKDSLNTLKKSGWVYAYGGVGLGKTSLAIRVAWEFLKERPAEKASFVSVNQYFLDQIKRNQAELAAFKRGDEFYDSALSFRRFVILDDFDKPNFANEHNMRVFLDLIERLKSKHVVFITANYSLPELYRRYREQWNIKPVMDRLRQQCLMLPEFKGQSKRKFKNLSKR
jgi:DNA replication protein DnaC